jgi:hypothetical protein
MLFCATPSMTCRMFVAGDSDRSRAGFVAHHRLSEHFKASDVQCPASRGRSAPSVGKGWRRCCSLAAYNPCKSDLASPRTNHNSGKRASAERHVTIYVSTIMAYRTSIAERIADCK